VREGAQPSSIPARNAINYFPLYLDMSSVHCNKEKLKIIFPSIYSLLKKYKIMVQKSMARNALIWRLIE